MKIESQIPIPPDEIRITQLKPGDVFRHATVSVKEIANNVCSLFIYGGPRGGQGRVNATRLHDGSHCDLDNNTLVVRHEVKLVLLS